MPNCNSRTAVAILALQLAYSVCAVPLPLAGTGTATAAGAAGAADGTDATTKDDPASTTSACVESDGTSCSGISSLSTGKLIGYSVCALGAVVLIGGIVIFVLKRYRKKNQQKAKVGGGDGDGDGDGDGGDSSGDSSGDEAISDSDTLVEEKKPPRKGSAGSGKVQQRARESEERRPSQESKSAPSSRRPSKDQQRSHARQASKDSGRNQRIASPEPIYPAPRRDKKVKRRQEISPSDIESSEEDDVEEKPRGHGRKTSR